MTDDFQIGPWLTAIRRRAGLTQEQAARLRSSSRGSQASVERADANPRLSTILDVFVALRVTAKLVIEHDDGKVRTVVLVRAPLTLWERLLEQPRSIAETIVQHLDVSDSVAEVLRAAIAAVGETEADPYFRDPVKDVGPKLFGKDRVERALYFLRQGLRDQQRISERLRSNPDVLLRDLSRHLSGLKYDDNGGHWDTFSAEMRDRVLLLPDELAVGIAAFDAAHESGELAKIARRLDVEG